MQDEESEVIQLDRSSCVSVRSTPYKGRGVFATASIPSNTVIEVSPVLIVPSSEYTGNKLQSTIFESYLFTWSRLQGDMAMALGLGSLFNHDPASPNVSYELDKKKGTIRYTTKRDIKEGEELCIYYGHGVYFGEKGELLLKKDAEEQETEQDVLSALGGLTLDDADKDQTGEVHEMSLEQEDKGFDEDEVIPLKEAPLAHVTKILAPEDIPLELMEVYTLTIPPKESASIIALLKAGNLDNFESLRQCRRIRRDPSNTSQAQVIISPVSHVSLPELETLFTGLPLFNGRIPSFAIVSVPKNPARTHEQLKEWSAAYWPVSLIPVKADVMAKERAEGFTAGKLRWIEKSLLEISGMAKQAKSTADENPIACLVSETWESSVHTLTNPPVVLAKAHDTRVSNSNPLKHAVMNLISYVAELDRGDTRPKGLRNSNYLLTGLTVFMTHEPCLLCSMALLHSRIHTLIYIKESPGAGGAGTEYSLHEEKTTNHRYEVWKIKNDGAWKHLRDNVHDIQADP